MLKFLIKIDLHVICNEKLRGSEVLQFYYSVDY